MIFATDHDAGDKIMAHLYGKALAEHEVMRQRAYALRVQKRQEQKAADAGQDAIFAIDEGWVSSSEREPHVSQVYQHEPPSKPFRRH